MNQNESCDQRCSEICQKIFRAISRVARGGQAPNSAQAEADPSFGAIKIQSNSEGGRRILVLKNGEGKSSTSDFPDNRVPIVAGPGFPVRGSGSEKTRLGSNPVRVAHEVTVGNGEIANKPKSESTLSVNQEIKSSGGDMDHRFSDYINRTLLKIRSMSNAGAGRDHAPTKDTGQDRHDYITQNKKKLRTTSGIGGGGGRGLSSK